MKNTPIKKINRYIACTVLVADAIPSKTVTDLMIREQTK
ncbi:MAG: hypothetical protein JWO58_2130 [Chitinophagaceae bacterium]|nr:hypothetical protein [Chitinophagaceae bacterium]